MSWTYDYQMPTATSDIILVNHRFEILLLKRSGSVGNGMWALPGGHVDPGESPKGAAYRELEEETGITGVSLKLFDVRKNLYDTESWRIKSIYYDIIRESDANLLDDITLDPKEHSAFKWCSMLSCRDLFSDHQYIINDFILTYLVK
jgi:ADP-ribose pyrophosphatase YjhB (NUDIX family)